MILIDNSISVVENQATILEDQKKAIEIYCRAKLQSNSQEKSIVGLYTMGESGSYRMIRPTSDIRVILKTIRAGSLPIGGRLDFDSGVRFAISGLENLPKHTRKRMLIFVGGPVNHFNHHSVELGKILKAKGVAVDVVSFIRHYNKNPFEEKWKKEKLDLFFGAANNNNNSHIVYVEPGFSVRDVLSSSGILPSCCSSTTLASSRPMEEEKAR